MGGVQVHLISSVMRKILRFFGNVVSCVSFVLIPTNELWLSKPTITVSRQGSTQQGPSQLSLIVLVCCTKILYKGVGTVPCWSQLGFYIFKWKGLVIFKLALGRVVLVLDGHQGGQNDF